MDNKTGYAISPDLHLGMLVQQKLQELESYERTTNPSQHYIKKQRAFLRELREVERKISVYKDLGAHELIAKVSKMRDKDSCLSGVIVHLSWDSRGNIGYIDMKTGGAAHGDR